MLGGRTVRPQFYRRQFITNPHFMIILSLTNFLLSKFTSILEFLQNFKTPFLSPLIFDGVPFNINDKL